MKAKEFITTLRKIIREEVRAAVKQELNEVLNGSQNQKSVVRSEVKRQPAPRQPAQPPQSMFNTGNPVLDGVLSETIVPRGFGNDGPSVVSEYEDMSFTTDMIPTSLNTAMSSEDLPSNVPLDSTMPFVRDYSQVLEKAEKISSGRL